MARRPKLPRQRYTLYLDQEQLTRLLAEQERTGATVSEIIRRAINDYLARGERD